MLVAALLPSLTYADTNTINTFSPYSMYGLGELQTAGTIQTRSMGGAGVATRSRLSINLLNPASYSIALRRGILFDFSMEGGVISSSQKVAGEMTSGQYITGNFHDIAVQIPIAKRLGVGISVTPYSSVGYQLESDAFLTSNGDFGKDLYSGSGDVTEVKVGAGWGITDRFSIGAALQYYWGDLDRSFTTYVSNITTPGTAVYPVGTESTSVSSVKGQLGMQWTAISTDKRALMLGATFDIGGDLKPRVSRVVTGYDDVYAQSDTTTMSIILPRQLSLGASYNTDKITLAVDYSYQNWGDKNDVVELAGDDIDIAYNNVNQLRVGLEYVPRRIDVRHYMKRVAYRVGARMGGYQYTFGGASLDQYAVTAGFGFPINMVGISKIDLGFEWNTVGSHKSIVSGGDVVGLVKQNTFKIALGFTLFGDDYWFQRPQID